jgi:hypothetical protein
LPRNYAAPIGGSSDSDACAHRGHAQAPRSWAGQAYPNLIYFNRVEEGNHFAAWQELDLFTTEVRAAFRSLR